MQSSYFESKQWVVVGGTGQIGHRIIEQILELNEKDAQLFASSRAVQNDLPAGTLAPTVLNKAVKWAEKFPKKIHWFGIDLESDTNTLQSVLQKLAHQLIPGRPTIVILAAAFTNVDACEKDPQNCKRINEENTIQVLKFFDEYFQAKIIFYSTDYVFDGKKGFYKEEEPRNAISVYGQSKVNVEEWIEKNLKNSLILRTTGVFDFILGSKNFVMQIHDMLLAGKPVRVPADQIANPIWAGDIAKATIELIQKNASGIYHVAGGTQLARIDFTKLIAEVFNFKNVEINSILTAELNQAARRPLLGGLSVEKLREELGWSPMSAKDALKYIKENFKEK